MTRKHIPYKINAMKPEKPLHQHHRIMRLLRSFCADPMVKFGAFFVFLLFIFMTIILAAEKGVNSGLHNYFDAIWFTIVSITTTGYGDVIPVTTAGRVAAMFLLFFGVMTFGAVSGKVASVLFEFRERKAKGLVRLKRMRKHFIICGWKHDFDLILKGILEANPQIPLDRIVLVNTASAEQIDRILTDDRFAGITYVAGDFTEEAPLLRANIKNAERVLILSDYSKEYSPLETDSRTVMGVLTVESLNPKAYVAAELIDGKFEKHLAAAHCDEIILSAEYERNLLVCASSGTGISHVLRDLIGTNADEGLAIADIPPGLTGKTFAEIRDYFCGKADENERAPIPIGILENTGNFYERRREALSEAQKNPDVQGVVNNMKKVKQLKSNHPVLAPDSSLVVKEGSKIILIYSNENGEKQEAAHD